LKAVLLAGGLGTRLRPLTDKIPKCLVPIRGTPLLKIWLDLCRKHGIHEVLINCQTEKADLLRHQLELFSKDLHVRVFVEETLLGSAGTIGANRNWLASESSFWIFYSDVLTNLDLSLMRAFHERHSCVATLGVYEVTNPTECGIAVVDEEGIIQQFVEKPAHPPGNLAFSGILIANSSLLDAIPRRTPADLGFDVIPHLAGKMLAYPIQEYLLDIGTMEKYNLAQTSWPGI
jgi:mannose-1-phosphate guanylyltransferase